MRKLLRSFFSNSDKSIRQDVLEAVIKEAEVVHDVIQSSSHGVRFYGSSLLVVYCAASADCKSAAAIDSLKV